MQLSTLGLVWPSLLLTYLGQAAFLTKHPEAFGAAYYASVPHPVFWPMFIIAVLAAIIASQVCNGCLLSVCLLPCSIVELYFRVYCVSPMPAGSAYNLSCTCVFRFDCLVQ